MGKSMTADLRLNTQYRRLSEDDWLNLYIGSFYTTEDFSLQHISYCDSAGPLNLKTSSICSDR